MRGVVVDRILQGTKEFEEDPAPMTYQTLPRR